MSGLSQKCAEKLSVLPIFLGHLRKISQPWYGKGASEEAGRASVYGTTVIISLERLLKI